MVNPCDDRSEIAFFDIETTVPTQPGQGFAILEFGAILVCPRKLEELRSFSTLVRPSNPSLISSLSVRCNGITPDSVESAPAFLEIADTVYDILHGRIWAGHNILRFDCPRVREAFIEIGRSPPEPKGTIDSLALLTQRFGRRAGDMKMASLATYFGLGKQKHRSLDDVRMNLEVLKYCATVLFLESSLPETFPERSWVSPNATTRSRCNGQSQSEGSTQNMKTPSSSSKFESIADNRTNEKHPIFSLVTNNPTEDPFDMATLSSEMNTNSFQPDATMEERPGHEIQEVPSTANFPERCNASVEYLDPEEVAVPSITASHIPLPRGGQKMVLLHKGVSLQLYCPRLKVRFGINNRFFDNAGRPRLSFVVVASERLCQVLEACDAIVQKLCIDSGSSSDWRPAVTRKGYHNLPTIRVQIPTTGNGDGAQYVTEMYQKETSGSLQKLVFSNFYSAELENCLKPGTLVDAFLSLDPYDYYQNSGIRLVAKKLVISDS
ncbi:hypothetical protein K2173_019685 [Erythroxylum novogranatense]|uniref:Exonuclease domain-containing protein n=1 Tax=Erythroxylum novogranatense TaxID=1862640 RepID=A0AAV8SMR9_9ROSI|nr:hypothetical protein K2173_019685 [Erythroxylum novogranatense]